MQLTPVGWRRVRPAVSVICPFAGPDEALARDLVGADDFAPRARRLPLPRAA